MSDLETKLRSLLRGQFSSMTLTFNDHAANYQTAAQAIDGIDQLDFADWISEEEKTKAVETNSVWILQWYPLTPVGFQCRAASTLDALLTHVFKDTE